MYSIEIKDSKDYILYIQQKKIDVIKHCSDENKAYWTL